MMQNRDKLNKELKASLENAQNRMKQIEDRKHTNIEFNEGDFVYLKLQPYCQTSLALRKNLKLSARYYCPYKILQRIGKVAYRLNLPASSKLHPVFHVSLLKKKIGVGNVTSRDPHEMGTYGQARVYPAIFLDKRKVKCHNRAVTQLPIQWSNLNAENATWEDYSVLKS
ncbi:hypothetical protein HRI_003094500 [Hibiscus trionum]|uniref:Tf2-1-like SH3-like domain-containing protein n=1 Tax=Hibiscus trionum TaxID=183268 RepID=A0A9W7IFK7_HIBTR|nr:hypothetical protein HRI_003094500 [Hibiscus trionum]